MNGIVEVVNDQVVVSSRQIADNFGKEHKDVLYAIREILTAEHSAAKFFIESSYSSRGKTCPEFLMNRDGFSLLVMGFTGGKAMEWKLKYINAFNAMETELRSQHEKTQQSLAYSIERAQAAFFIANTLAKTFNVPQERAAAHALSVAQKDIGMPTDPFRALIPSVPVTETALLNPTEIGKRLIPTTAAAKVNKLLEKLGFQKKVGKQWQLTEAGSAHGENRPYERNNHSGFQIQWRDSVVQVLQSSLE